jgi:hypothetical protein
MKKLLRKWLGISDIDYRQKECDDRIDSEWQDLIKRQWQMCEMMDKIIELTTRVHNLILSNKNYYEKVD